MDLLTSAMTAVERLLFYQSIPIEAACQTTVLFSRPCSSSSRAHHDHAKDNDEDEEDTAAAAAAAWPQHGAINFDHVVLRYRPGLPVVLSHVSLAIRGGDKVGICGRTGAGKSSLLTALFRMAEIESGSISIDGISIHEMPLRQLRRALAVIPQDPVLFSGTLRENLDPFHEMADAEIIQVLAQIDFIVDDEDTRDETTTEAGAHEKKRDIMTRIRIAENGANLSVGQRQLVCIARALLRKSKIIMMDEATANVDLTTDQTIQTTMRTAFQDETVLTIAHRVDTILHCDRIAVLEQGQVVEYDTPQALLDDTTSAFYGLVQQARLI
jgi:ABC-type multidrug transport system fused ATPase/permease subunit